jgi:hypothetical protein
MVGLRTWKRDQNSILTSKPHQYSFQMISIKTIAKFYLTMVKKHIKKQQINI